MLHLNHGGQKIVTSQEHTHIESLATMHGLQLISDPTHLLPNSSSCIDLIFTDQSNLAIVSGVHRSFHVKCHHQIIRCKFNLMIVYHPPYERLVWDYKRAKTAATINSINQGTFHPISSSPHHWHHPSQNFFPWTHHEIWLKTKINLQFQLYWSKETHFFRQRKFVQKQEIWVSRPSILDPGYFRKYQFMKLKIILFGYKCTQVRFQGWGIQKSWLESQNMTENISFEPISVLLQHF